MSFTAITPPDMTPLLNVKIQVFIDAMNEMLPYILEDFLKTVETWTTQPEFIVTPVAMRGNNLVGGVATDNEIYSYVNNGTEPHAIYPVYAKALRFWSGFSPKTTPGVIGSKQGGSGGDAIFAQAVMHPGSAARNFDQAIMKQRQPQLEALIRLAIAKN